MIHDAICRIISTRSASSARKIEYDTSSRSVCHPKSGRHLEACGVPHPRNLAVAIAACPFQLATVAREKSASQRLR